MTPENYRGLPLIYAHVNPYGRCDLDLDSRIDFGNIVAWILAMIEFQRNFLYPFLRYVHHL